jgi:hypothetical protein
MLCWVSIDSSWQHHIQLYYTRSRKNKAGTSANLLQTSSLAALSEWEQTRIGFGLSQG